MTLLNCENLIHQYSKWLGSLATILLILLLMNIFYDIVMPYLFNDVSIGMQELEWNFYASIFLLGVPYALTHNGHVRVDVFNERQSINTRAWIDIFGVVIFLLLFSLLVGYYSLNFVADSYSMGEQSGDPGGLTYRCLIKSVIPFAFFSIALCGLGFMLHAINTIRGLHNHNNQPNPETLS
jgi:TRAP-type mannitol/chloroaromatic compound transport system permease small subunit